MVILDLSIFPTQSLLINAFLVLNAIVGVFCAFMRHIFGVEFLSNYIFMFWIVLSVGVAQVLVVSLFLKTLLLWCCETSNWGNWGNLEEFSILNIDYICVFFCELEWTNQVWKHKYVITINRGFMVETIKVFIKLGFKRPIIESHLVYLLLNFYPSK